MSLDLSHLGALCVLFRRYYVGVVYEGAYVVIGLLIVGAIFVQVVLLSMGSYLSCFEGEHLLPF